MVVRSSIARVHASSPVVVVLAVHLTMRKLDIQVLTESGSTHQSRVGQHGGLVSLVVGLHVVSSVVERDGHVGRSGLITSTGAGDPAHLSHLLACWVLGSHVRVARRQTKVRGGGRHGASALAGLARLLRWRGGVRDVRLRHGLALDVQSLSQLVQSG